MNRSEYKQCILIVYDDAALRDLVSGYLGSSGYLVVEAGDGAAMRAVLSEHAVDLLILDLMLPGEDGLSLLRWLREHHGPPVIIVSARGDEVDRVVGLELGADDYLAKPFGPRELLARVRAVLRRGETIVFIEWFCNINGCTIEVLNHTYKTPHAELVGDFMAIMHCFSSKLYFLRRYKDDIKKDIDTGLDKTDKQH